MASLATNTHSLPCTTPMPVTIPAECARLSYRSFAASVESSRNGVAASHISAILSLGRLLPRSRCLWTYFPPPPSLAISNLALRASTRARLVAERDSKSSLPRSMRVVSLSMPLIPPRQPASLQLNGLDIVDVEFRRRLLAVRHPSAPVPYQQSALPSRGGV